MAIVNVTTDETKTRIEVPAVSSEVMHELDAQVNNNSEFIILMNHVFSKMSINHIEVIPHDDEKAQIEEMKKGDQNDGKEPVYMG